MNVNRPVLGRQFILHSWHDDEKPRKNYGRSLKSNRLPFLNWVPDNFRNHFVATSAEFTGTTLFLLFAFSGTEVALLASPESEDNFVGAQSNPSQLLYIALSFGFSLAVNAWVFFRISGGLFNPAVTLGMCLVGALPYFRGLLLAISQILGGITAAAIVSALFPGPLTVRTVLAGGTSIVQGLFIEMFLTALLVFTIFMLAAEKHKGTFIAPIGIGLSLFVAELTGVYFTGGSVNPARSFGPNVVTHKFNGYHWIYWVGPIFGSLLASGFYLFIKKLEYETANPGQDSHTYHENAHFNPDLEKQQTNGMGNSDVVTFAPVHPTQLEYGNVIVDHGASASGGRAYTNTRSFSYIPTPAPAFHPTTSDGVQSYPITPSNTANSSSFLNQPNHPTDPAQINTVYPPSPSLKSGVNTPLVHPAMSQNKGKERSGSGESDETVVEKAVSGGMLPTAGAREQDVRDVTLSTGVSDAAMSSQNDNRLRSGNGGSGAWWERWDKGNVPVDDAFFDKE